MASFDRARLQGVATNLLEVAYPRRCAGCGLRGRWVCDECLEKTPLFAEPRCVTCSMPLDGAVCDCSELPDRIDRMWVAGPYETWLRSAIYSFKFKGETARTSHLAAMVAFGSRLIGPDAALVAVPLHSKRKRERGYDQTSMLARAIAKETGQPLFDGMTKVRNTPQQVGLSASERSLNLLGAFDLKGGVRVPDRVVLVDDVATTGATLTECAIALRRGGAVWVGAVAIAHGL